MPIWTARDKILADQTNPKIMGIVNVTPDSFSDGGRFATIETAVAHARLLAAQGADILDVGGESSRPGAAVVPLDEELRRVVPVIEEVSKATGLPISVDTVKPAVGRAAIAAGASILNDIEGFRDKPEMLKLAAETGVAVVIMHMAGTPQTMQIDPRYANVVDEVYDYLAERVEEAELAGIARERIAIDPGIGFGKTFEHNLLLLRNLRRFVSLECAILIGTSRKGFLGTITGRSVNNRATASVMSSFHAIQSGASIVRVHDVGPMADAIKIWSALQGWEN